MLRQASSLFVRPHDGAQEGAEGERTKRPPRHCMKGGDQIRGGMPCGPGHAGRGVLARGLAEMAFLVCAITFAQALGLVGHTHVAFAAQTITFDNGGTARLNDDGTITGRCTLHTVWTGMMESFTLTMPDGQHIHGECLDHGLAAPADDEYDFTATPIGDGTYSVLVHSNQAVYYQMPDNPRIPTQGFAPQRIGTEPWRVKFKTGGMARVKKTSAASAITSDIDVYSLKGAKFSIWSNSECTESASDAVLTTKEDGTTTPVKLDEGTYWLREDKAPYGFKLKERPTRFTVANGETTVIELSDEPIWLEPSVIVQKVDATTGEGGAGLGGAEFAIRYYDGAYKKNTLPETATRTWVLKSNDDGIVPWAKSAKIRGDKFYLYDDKPVIPLGTITIQEVKAPSGYYLEGQSAASPDDYEAPVHVISVDENTVYAVPSIGDLELRAGISVVKHDAETGGVPQGDATLAGIKFQIVNANQKSISVGGVTYGPGETILPPLVTDEQGRASTSKDYLPLGTYEVIEVATNSSYSNTSKAQVVALDTPDAYTVVAASEAFTDDVVRGGVRVVKRDADLGRAEPEGDATLEGATFSVTLESNSPVVVGGKTYTKGQVVATMTTDAGGRAQTGAQDLPYGTYTVREAKPPVGYLPDTTYRQTFSIRVPNEIVDLSEYSVDEPVVRGGVRLGKVDHDLMNASAQGDATLEGAEFSVYVASPHPVVVDGVEYAPGSVALTLVTGADGRVSSGNRDLPYGTYHVRETRAPEGYLLNESFDREFQVRTDGEIVDLGSQACEDAIIRGGIAVGKVSRETSQHLSQGEATLKGAQFTIELVSSRPVVVEGVVYDSGSVVHTLTTDENGYAATDAHLLPYGTYIVREVEAPAGFLLNEDWSATVYVREDGMVYDLSGEASSVDDQVMRGGFGFNKVEEDSMERMGNAVFRITSMTTGESHIAVTDENGLFHTETYPHTRQTNQNDAAVGTDDSVVEELLAPDAGVWFSGRTDVTTVPNDGFGALPYDVYEVTELRSSRNKDKQLVSFTVRIHDHEYVADMGTVDDKEEPTPNIATTLTYDETQHVAPATERLTLVDTVRYEGLTPNKTYEVVGELMDKETGELLRSADGTAITATNSITPTTSSGQTTVVFVFDATSLAGTTTVAFEHLMQDGHEVATHADLEDEGQTVRFPSIGTTLTDGVDNHEVGSGTERLTLIDSVSYTNLEPGRRYVMHGTLMDKRTGEALLDGEGRPISASVNFVADQPDGVVDVPFALTSDLVAGKTTVAFERVERQDVTLALHEDLADEGQTVTVPSIQTELTDEGANHVAVPSGTVTLVDTVTYTNLIPGATYEIRGVVMDKATGEPLLGADGQPFEASTTFSTDTAEGTAQVHFAVDASLVAGREIVAFESLLRDGRELAIHANIEDESQTVYVPSIGTTLTGSNGEHEVAATPTVELIDAVAYRGLQPHVTYRMTGKIVDAQTGEALLNPDGTEVTSECVFEPETTDGNVQVSFTLNASQMAGKSVVCFEALWQGEGEESRELVSHEDIADKEQTVIFPLIATKASDDADGDDYVAGTGTVRVRDEVSYENLRPGTEYVMRGTLYDKKSGQSIVHKNGNPVSAEAVFVPTEPSGVVSLVFEFDASLVQSTAVVAFESCLRDSVEVAVHADINDEDQTVQIARISTTAVDKKSGTHEADASTKLQIVDTVTYEGLVVGTTYRLDGTLYNKQTGEPLNDAHGKPVKASGEFVPKDSSGRINLTFEFDASNAGGVTAVAFERLSAGSHLVATHEDINDKDQSVVIKKPEDEKKESEPKQGEKTNDYKTPATSGTSAAGARAPEGTRASTPRTGDSLVSPIVVACGGTLLMSLGMLRAWSRRKK